MVVGKAKRNAEVKAITTILHEWNCKPRTEWVKVGRQRMHLQIGADGSSRSRVIVVVP